MENLSKKDNKKKYMKGYMQIYLKKPHVIEKIKKYNKQYNQNPKNKASNKERRKIYLSNPENKEKAKIKAILTKYRLSQEEFKKILGKSGGKCEICYVSLYGLEYKLNIDHCHKTNKVRGILCRNCNLGIGFFEENKKVLSSAIKYLKNYD